MSVRRILAGILLVAVAVRGAPPRVTGADAWVWPAYPHPVVRGYEAPASTYGAGHRGIDLAAHPGQKVAAPADGVVSFAGVVADRPLVTVRLRGGVLVTLEPMRPSVHAGERVEAGDVIGVVATGGHCGRRCLHLGARLHGAYVSPLLFLGGIPRAVLLPMRGQDRMAAEPGQARGWAVR